MLLHQTEIPIYVFLLDAYNSVWYHILEKREQAERLASKNRLSCPVTILRSETGQLFYFTKYLKSYLSCFCIKAITATISTHMSHMQLNASKVTILPPPHARQAVFIPSCAVQNSVTTLRYIFYHSQPYSSIVFWKYSYHFYNLPHNTHCI